MTVLRVATFAAATLIATASLTGLASAQAAPSPSAASPAFYEIHTTAYGPTAASATATGDQRIVDIGCVPKQPATTGQLSNGTWYAIVVGVCTGPM